MWFGFLSDFSVLYQYRETIPVLRIQYSRHAIIAEFPLHGEGESEMSLISIGLVPEISSFAPWVSGLFSLDNFTEIGRNCRLQVLADVSY